MTLEHKTWLALQWISSVPHFSLPIILHTLFSSESGKIKTWIIEQASVICAQEASFITDKAKDGPFSIDAENLQVPASGLSVDIVKAFSFSSMLETYERALPHLQCILKAVVQKDKKAMKKGTEDPDQGQVLVNSVLLNLHSHQTNYHACMNSILLWDNKCQAILSLSEDSLAQAQLAANDPAKLKSFHMTILTGPKRLMKHQHSMGEGTEGLTAEQIMSADSFQATLNKCHELSPDKSLADIMPSLIEEIPSLSALAVHIPLVFDPKAISTHKTEEYYLPTFDQEQGST
ncbi:hypothetical protein BDQ17DRAFT_1437199 [Cyathus striatus]|nr:hypothetical protein BDQ17DRAFT_1437199 [Cyathus striatus]